MSLTFISELNQTALVIANKLSFAQAKRSKLKNENELIKYLTAAKGIPFEQDLSKVSEAKDDVDRAPRSICFETIKADINHAYLEVATQKEKIAELQTLLEEQIDFKKGKLQSIASSAASGEN